VTRLKPFALSFLTFFMLTTKSFGQRMVVQDMVAVKSTDGRIFLMDIFEVSCETARSVDRSFCERDDNLWKPARLSFDQAKRVCDSARKRLPTKDEWLTAATNMGSNRLYSLVNDSIKRPDGTIIPNIARTTQSLATTDFAALGIDAIGTVGLTGNRSEFVADGDGTNVFQCGGEYETRDITSVTLDKICWPWAPTRTSTSRCVTDLSDNIQVEYTKFVNGELLIYLNSLSVTSGLDELLIPENQFTKMRRDDPERLSLPRTPNAPKVSTPPVVQTIP
jgi:hypothetical protein